MSQLTRGLVVERADIAFSIPLNRDLSRDFILFITSTIDEIGPCPILPLLIGDAKYLHIYSVRGKFNALIPQTD